MRDKSNLDQLRQELVSIHAQATKIVSTAKAARREVSESERLTVDRLNSQFKGLETELALAENAEFLSSSTGVLTQGIPPGRRISGAGASPIDATDDLRAFGEWARTGRGLAGAMNSTVMTEGTSADGGYTVPTRVSDQIREVQKAQGAIRGLASIMQLDAPVAVPVATSLPGAQWVGESDARSAQTVPVMASATLAGGAMSAVASLTTFLIADSAWPLENWIVGAMGRQFGLTESNGFINGTGATNQVKGILAYPQAATADGSRAWGTVEKLHTGISAGGVTADHVLDLSIKLDPAYRKNAVVIMAPSTLAALLKVKASTAGSYLLDGASTATGLPSIFGLPVHLDPFVPAIAAGSSSVIVGDIRAAYMIQDIGQPSLLRDPYSVKGSIVWWSERRIYAGLVDSNAVKIGVCSV